MPTSVNSNLVLYTPDAPIRGFHMWRDPRGVLYVGGCTSAEDTSVVASVVRDGKEFVVERPVPGQLELPTDVEELLAHFPGGLLRGFQVWDEDGAVHAGACRGLLAHDTLIAVHADGSVARTAAAQVKAA